MNTDWRTAGSDAGEEPLGGPVRGGAPPDGGSPPPSPATPSGSRGAWLPRPEANGKDLAMIAVIGLALSLLYAHLIPSVHHYPHAGKELYLGAKLLAQGHNPYSSPQLIDASRRYAPEGMAAGFPRQPQIHLPATLAILIPASALPWTLFCALQLVVNACCIPAIVFLCLSYLRPRPPLWTLLPLSLVVAFLAPTWQNVKIGQIALPLTLGFLLLARAFARGQAGRLGLLTFLTLLKFTFALPLIAFVFWKGRRAQRVAMALAGAAFVLLNAVAVLRIGVHPFLTGYRAQVAASFGPGGLNDVRTAEGQSARLDLESLLAAVPLKLAAPVQLAVCAALAGAFLYAGRGRPHFSLWHVSALSVLTLLLFYHRVYDAVLLLPCLALGYAEWQRGSSGRALPVVVMGLVLVSFGAIGNGSHSVVSVVLGHLHVTAPLSLHALLTLALYLCVVFAAPLAIGAPKVVAVPQTIVPKAFVPKAKARPERERRPDAEPRPKRERGLPEPPVASKWHPVKRESPPPVPAEAPPPAPSPPGPLSSREGESEGQGEKEGGGEPPDVSPWEMLG